ncbi:MAG: peptidase M14 [Bacteroidetes bacterium]|nr:peptidase M14 [Bacteroidota bacterium]
MSSSLHAQQQFAKTLYDSYETYKVQEITTRRISHPELMKIIDRFAQQMPEILSVETVGTSAEGREIRLLKIGAGTTKIFMWSQMHGDEPTATMGLMDLLSYINNNKKSPEVQAILKNTTLLIIPMLNPDGALRFQRRTSQGIDMNRDAQHLQTPEANILKSIRDKYNPEIGFNLHDQDPHYTVGQTGKWATIALLTPAYNYAKEDNAVRMRAKKVAAELVTIFKPFIDGHVSRYDDTFEPRAFGDNIQKWGTSTILIESGGWPNDPEKMFIRKLNCVALLSVFHSIATKTYERTDISHYENLPDNTRNLYDVIIKNVTLKFSDSRKPMTADVGIDYHEIKDTSGVTKRIGRVVDLGDLSIYVAFETIDGSGKTLDASIVEMNDRVDVDSLREQLKK